MMISFFYESLRQAQTDLIIVTGKLDLRCCHTELVEVCVVIEKSLRQAQTDKIIKCHLERSREVSGSRGN
jgi:hypothetical protein